MKIITFDDVKRLNISPAICYKWVDEIIRMKENAVLPAKIHINMRGNVFCNVMPSIVQISTNIICVGVKVVSRYPERIPSLDSSILLFDARTGEYLCVIDGNWITAMRTGAVATHSIIHFAKNGWSTLGIIGLGNVARASILVLASKFPNRPITIKLLRYKEQAEQFEARFSGFSNLNFQLVDTVEECVRGTDVILSCATYFENNIAQDEWFEDGVLVVPVHTRGFTNCDLFFDKVFADDTGHVDHFENFAKFRYYAEVSDVINGKSVGRENDKERIITYNIGISIHDINYAGHIYYMLKDKSRIFDSLKEADMNKPIEKFWI